MINFKKSVIESRGFLVSKYEKNKEKKSVLFIHGGPGFNCKIVEHLIENENLFEKLDCNLFLYDQRGCGKSRHLKKDSSNVLHNDNVNDLNEIIESLEKDHSTKIDGLIGHSYGAKLLYDFNIKFNLAIPSVFVGTADNLLTPRLNNLSLDLAYLKKYKPEKYFELMPKIENITLSSLWEISEELSPIFAENPDRKFMNWANLEYYEKIKDIDPEISPSVFVSVRKDLYSKESNFPVDITSLKIKYIWINGFHDFIMGGMSDAFKHKDKKIFYKSSHYPHIEENLLFCNVINNFLDKI